MKIYIQSRGYSPNHDYIWVEKRENQQAEELDSKPVSQGSSIIIINKAISLINTQDFSVVLFREQNQLLLLLTGLPTERKDRQNRRIRNSITWKGTNTEEPILRKIAALLLENKFPIPESAVVNSSDSPFGFKVNWKEIEELIPSGAESNSLSDNQNIGKIAFFSEDMNKELAHLLMQYCLPSRDGALVVVTEFEQIQKVFEEAKVWRGISSDPSILSGTWQRLKVKQSEDITGKKNAESNIIDEGIKLLPENVQSDVKEMASSTEEFFNSLIKNFGLGFFMLLFIVLWLAKIFTR